jgi:hypothetical protein
MANMWNWIRPASTSPATPSALAAPDPPPAAPRGHVKSGPYRQLHEYLRKRYADTVVLTFDQIEDLLGATLPAEAWSDQDWWSRTTVIATDAQCSDAWVLANRTARPNLRARIVVFDRIA